jgi:hypothetical protein
MVKITALILLWVGAAHHSLVDLETVITDLVVLQMLDHQAAAQQDQWATVAALDQMDLEAA